MKKPSVLFGYVSLGRGLVVAHFRLGKWFTTIPYCIIKKEKSGATTISWGFDFPPPPVLPDYGVSSSPPTRTG